MNQLAKKRLANNFKRQIQFLGLVFNDFFILALIFLFGALMFWYANAMKTIPAKLPFYKPLIAGILMLPFIIGKIATLFKEADRQFLFTEDQNLRAYFKPMLYYSMILPTILIVLTGGILFPFAILKAQLSIATYVSLIIVLLINKYMVLSLEIDALYFNGQRKIWIYNLLNFAILLFIVFANAGYLSILTSLVFLPFLYHESTLRNEVFDWRYAIAYEERRKNLVYSIYSMFTDVPEKPNVIKRRKYLDFLLPKKWYKESANSFLYRRTLLRNPDYLNLIIRMGVFAILLSWLLQNPNWSLGIVCLIMFLLLYQLLPLQNVYKRNVMYHVQPIDSDSKSALIKVITYVLLTEWLIISAFWLLIFKNIQIVIDSVVLFVFLALLVRLYLPMKLSKRNGRNNK